MILVGRITGSLLERKWEGFVPCVVARAKASVWSRLTCAGCSLQQVDRGSIEGRGGTPGSVGARSKGVGRREIQKGSLDGAEYEHNFW
jgi:hypothetical protein